VAVRDRLAHEATAGGVSARPARCATALVAFALLAVAPARAAMPAAAGDTWVEARSPRFHVFSNAGEGAARDAARHLERLADAMARTTVGLRVDGGRDVRVYVFRDLGSFRPYRPDADDEWGVNAGYQVSGRDADYIAYFQTTTEDPLRFAAHEYTHAVVRRNFGHLPVWANEGLAEFYATFTARANGAQIGRAIPEHLAHLRDHELSIAHLTAIDEDHPDYRGGPNRATVYAESWGLVHMLFMEDGDTGRFDRLLATLALGTPGLDALRGVYGAGAPDSLLATLRSYARRSSHAYVEHAFDAAAAPITLRVLDAVDARIALGDLLAHGSDGQLDAAREHLDAAWAGDSTRAQSAALLAQLDERRHQRTDAARWIAAVERAPDDARACGIAGALLQARRLEGRTSFAWPAPGPGEDARRGRALLSRALALEPSRGEWLAAYGMTYLDDSTAIADGVDALLTAQAGSPARCDLVGGLSILALRSGNRAAAIARYRDIPKGDQRAYWRGQAGHLIAHEVQHELVELTHAHRFADGETLATRIRRDITEDGVAEWCDGWIATLRANAAQSRGSTAAMAAGSGGAAAPAERTGARGARPAAGGRPAPRPDPARARFEQRIAAARDLLSRGSAEYACKLFELILADGPPADLRHEVEGLRAKGCRAWR